ncbi:hypothetical protein AVEN_263427-1, partial [Araneus ventricosus]
MKRLDKNSIYDLNPQSTQGRDGMNGLEATYRGLDFVPKKFRATRYSSESVGVLSIKFFLPR